MSTFFLEFGTQAAVTWARQVNLHTTHLSKSRVNLLMSAAPESPPCLPLWKLLLAPNLSSLQSHWHLAPQAQRLQPAQRLHPAQHCAPGQSWMQGGIQPGTAMTAAVAIDVNSQCHVPYTECSHVGKTIQSPQAPQSACHLSLLMSAAPESPPCLLLWKLLLASPLSSLQSRWHLAPHAQRLHFAAGCALGQNWMQGGSHRHWRLCATAGACP